MNRRLLAFPLSLLAHVLVVALVLVWAKLDPAPKRVKARPVSMRTINANEWAYNRGKVGNAPAKNQPKAKPETPPKGQIVDVAPGNNKRPDESKYIAETNNVVDKETRAREQTNKYSRAAPKNQAKPEAAPAVKGLTGGRAAPAVSAVSALDRLSMLGGRPQRLSLLEQEAATGKESNLDSPDKAGQEDGDPTPPVTGDATETGGGAPNDNLRDVAEGEGTFLNTREWKYAAFFNRVKQAVSARWDPMSRLRANRQESKLGTRDRVTVLGVSLRPDGTIADIYVSESSGIDALDQESIAAFERAAPFGNPPPALIRNGLIQFAFSFNVQNDTALRFR